MTPEQAFQLSTLSLSENQARGILREMGIDLPQNINAVADLDTTLRDLTFSGESQLAASRAAEFVDRAYAVRGIQRPTDLPTSSGADLAVTALTFRIATAQETEDFISTLEAGGVP